MIAIMNATTAAILVIGDEILSGKVEDTNARLLIGELRELGVALRRILIIPDDVETVSAAVRELSLGFDHVFTSGGVGPTHDDVTMEAIARALGRPLQRDPAMEHLLRTHFGARLTPAALKMAELPAGTELTAERGWPVMRIRVEERRIYVLPGIPELCLAKIEALEAIPGELPDAGGWALERLHTELDEADLATLLVVRPHRAVPFAPGTIEAPTENMHVASTVLDAFGLTAPAAFKAPSLLSLTDSKDRVATEPRIALTRERFSVRFGSEAVGA